MLELSFEPPVHKFVSTHFDHAKIDVFIKREDLIHPFVSGNKWRKLKYVLEDARQKGMLHLVSFGGAYSNHLVALACAGARYGFKTSAYVRGEPVKNHMLNLCTTYGMELIFTDRESYKNKWQLFENRFDKNTAYFIDEGGKGNLAQKGCAEMISNITGFSHVCCAIGTGTTFAGIVNGLKKNTIAEGFCVLKNAEAINQEIEQMIHNKTICRIIHHHFHFGGYAKSNEIISDFIRKSATEQGILFDQVYTAKMMLGIIHLAQQGHYPKGSRILAIHTGGLLGLLSQL